MSNASNENSQDPAGTPVLRSNEGHVPCPSWCIRHEDWDFSGSPEDRSRVHFGLLTEAAGSAVQLSRHDWLHEARPGAVSVKVDDDFLTPQQATALAGALATTAASAGPDDTTIVRILDLPQGTDYVLHEDVGVVVLSSRLDEPRRLRVLSELGLT